MAYDATKPAIADNYSTGYTQAIRDNMAEIVKLFDGSTITGTPATGMKRYNSGSGLFEQYSGGWVEMPLDYLKKTSSGTQTVGGTVNVSTQLQEAGSRVWTAATFVKANYALIAGQVFTGAISTSGSYTITAGGRLFGNGDSSGNGLGKVTVSTSQPSGGSQGDIWCVYTPT
jgi:hypothetical protein